MYLLVVLGSVPPIMCIVSHSSQLLCQPHIALNSVPSLPPSLPPSLSPQGKGLMKTFWVDGKEPETEPPHHHTRSMSLTPGTGRTLSRATTPTSTSGGLYQRLPSVPTCPTLRPRRRSAQHPAVEPLNSGHVGTIHFVLYREVVLSLEVTMYWYNEKGPQCVSFIERFILYSECPLSEVLP